MKDINYTEIVIKIPDRIHYGIENGITVNGSEASQIVLDAVKNGIVLPKGHGALKDIDALVCRYTIESGPVLLWAITRVGLEAAPTIIPADKEVNE